MGCSNFDDRYQECEFLIDEFKLIIFQSSSNQYTENEKIALDKYTDSFFFYLYIPFFKINLKKKKK